MAGDEAEEEIAVIATESQRNRRHRASSPTSPSSVGRVHALIRPVEQIPGGRVFPIPCDSVAIPRDSGDFSLLAIPSLPCNINGTMRAIQVQKTGGPEVLTPVDLPVPKPKPNEAVVKICAAGVNFIDVYFREGRYPAQVPFVDGQEAAGTVTEIGSEVKSLKPGDRVAYTGVLGAYAEYSAVPADRLVRVPSGLNDPQAPAAHVPGRAPPSLRL